ncbi:hypothetical protein LK533_14050 [Sphingomonas sp. PL-96]|uniref:hypothetical protein n=1 Tax=Sphingomonas sp. PL-96 TaxID=2887201 RepID=UPI001E5D9FF9|nr:hypothetical protein [Sphingomonas sp. PL-96]MCC2977794.1 hypothetical protein [Sphingomonas sp. PL-96]
MAARDMGTPDHNLSTEHQKQGDATRPSDTLDKPAGDVPPAKDYDPAGDVGKAQPGGR